MDRSKPSRLERILIEAGASKALYGPDTPNAAEEEAIRAWPDWVSPAVLVALDSIVTGPPPEGLFEELKARFAS